MSALSGLSVPVPSERAATIRSHSRLARLAARFTIAFWVPIVLVIGAYLLGGHLLTLPAPTRENPQLTHAIAAIQIADGRDRWVVLHVLYEDCRCSARMLNHLLSRGADPTIIERIVFVETSVHEPSAAGSVRAESRGFGFERLSAEELGARYGVQAAPLMVVADPKGVVRYIGGYTDRKGSLQFRDREIVRALRAQNDVAALPVFGCPVSKALDDAVDPFGLVR